MDNSREVGAIDPVQEEVVDSDTKNALDDLKAETKQSELEGSGTTEPIERELTREERDLEIYRQLLSEHPDDEYYQRRIQQIEERLGIQSESEIEATEAEADDNSIIDTDQTSVRDYSDFDRRMIEDVLIFNREQLQRDPLNSRARRNYEIYQLRLASMNRSNELPAIEGNDEEAIQFYREILSENPYNQHVSRLLLPILERTGRTEEAEDLRESLTHMPFLNILDVVYPPEVEEVDE